MYFLYLNPLPGVFPLTVIMKGTALIISRMKGTRNTCSQTLPWKQKPHTGSGNSTVMVTLRDYHITGMIAENGKRHIE